MWEQMKIEMTQTGSAEGSGAEIRQGRLLALQRGGEGNYRETKIFFGDPGFFFQLFAGKEPGCLGSPRQCCGRPGSHFGGGGGVGFSPGLRPVVCVCASSPYIYFNRLRPSSSFVHGLLQCA